MDPKDLVQVAGAATALVVQKGVTVVQLTTIVSTSPLTGVQRASTPHGVERQLMIPNQLHLRENRLFQRALPPLTGARWLPAKTVPQL